ncbi:MAG: MFS transporter, partial [Xanthobacteraceae bacterium]
FILTAVMAAACVSFVTIPLSGHISDLIGRKKMYLIGVVTMGLFGFLYFGMVDTAAPSAVFIAIVLSLIPHDMQYGPQAALIAESFTPRLRYSGASLGYQLASIIAGGPAPIIATALFAAYHTGYAIAMIITIVYWKAGFSWLQRGYEYTLLWGLICFAIALRGGGPYSLDRKLGREL